MEEESQEGGCKLVEGLREWILCGFSVLLDSLRMDLSGRSGEEF